MLRLYTILSVVQDSRPTWKCRFKKQSLHVIQSSIL